MRDRRHVGDAGDFITTCVQSTHGGLPTRTWALDVDVEVLQAVLQRSLTSALCSDLGSERSALTRAAETGTTRSSPGQRIALTIGDGHDGVVERRGDVGDAINTWFFDYFKRTSRRYRTSVVRGKWGHGQVDT